MKRRVLWWLLGLEAAVCIALSIVRPSSAHIFSAAMAFPFEQIGLGLRTLSLSGTFGNAAAIAIYIIVSLLPAAVLLILRKKRKLFAEDGLLGLLSAALFAVLYLMTNPGIITAFTGAADMLSAGKAVLGSVIYSVLCGYLVLRALRLFFHSGDDRLVRYMSVMLGVLGAVFVYLAFGAGVSSMLGSIAALQAGNAGNEHLLNPSYVFLALQFVIDALPYVLDVLVIFAALRLLGEFRADRYSPETVAETGRMSRLCVIVLVVTVLLNISFNLLQLIFAKSLMIVNISVEIPVLSIAFVLAALLLTRFVAENKQLKDDNDMFI